MHAVKIQIASKIKSLSVGKSFFVKTESDRKTAIRDFQALRHGGVVKFDLVTKKQEDGTFKVAAI